MERRAFLSCAVLAVGGLAATPAAAWAGSTGKLAAGAWLRSPEFVRYDVDAVHAVHYAEVACGYGALRFAAATGDTVLRDKAVARHERLVAAAIPDTANHVDANVYGVLPLEIARQTGDKDCLALRLAMANGQWRETTPDGLSRQARYWIDDVWMIGMLQVEAWRVTATPGTSTARR